MKKITLFTLLILSNFVLAQTAKQQVQNNSKQVVVIDKQSKSRMQKGNKHNSKYMEKYRYQNNNQSIVCESNSGRRNHCRADTKFGINFLRQLSSSSCDRNWGYDQSGIWVTNGCRAEFTINFGWDQPGSEGNVLFCESHEYRRNYCRAYLNGRDVFLLRQLSNSSCINNWGYDRNGIWVTNGCRAEFVVEDRHWTQNNVVICSSRNQGFQACDVDTRGGVQFIRQLSRSSCNGNWGYDRHGIWVSNGCRAKFKLLPYNNWSQGNNQRSTVKCSSKGHRRKVCQADTSGGVRLKKQHSRSSCRGNWGYTANQIWVDNGCRATFQLHINGNGYGYGNNNGNNGYGNQNITCSSHNLQRRTCSIPNGSRVELYRQLSKRSCRGNWGYNGREIWVKNGCRAEFKIQ